MFTISKFALLLLTTLGVALAGAGPALAREYDDRPAAVQAGTHVTEQVTTTTTASPLWQFVVVAILAATMSAIIALAIARIARRNRPRRAELLSA